MDTITDFNPAQDTLEFVGVDPDDVKFSPDGEGGLTAKLPNGQDAFKLPGYYSNPPGPDGKIPLNTKYSPDPEGPNAGDPPVDRTTPIPSIPPKPKDPSDVPEDAGEDVEKTFTRPDPLAVDLNRSGHIEMLPANSVHFDIDGGDKMRESVSWISPEDGWLILDKNANGRVDDVTEMFGSETQSGFAHLRALDVNGDGVIDDSDPAFAQLAVWQDKNSDGQSTADEILSVKDDLFFLSIPTFDQPPGSNVNVIDAAVGSVRIENVFLSADHVNTVYGGEVTYTHEALLQPDLRGYGDLPPLSAAMSLDPALLAMSESITSQPFDQIIATFGTVNDQFTALMYRWAGVQNIAPDSRGPFLDDARKLEFLEEMLQQEFLQFRTAGSPNPLSIPAQQIMDIFDNVKQSMIGRFLMQSGAQELYDTPATYDPLLDRLVFDGTPQLNVDALNELGAQGAAATNPQLFWSVVAYVIDATHNPSSTRIGDGISTLSPTELSALNHAVQLSSSSIDWPLVANHYNDLLPFAPRGLGDTVPGSENDDVLTGTENDDLIDGGAGNDIIFGLDGNDQLVGGAGNDRLIGGKGADNLIGGEGNDILEPGRNGTLMEGGTGNDGYMYSFGQSDYIIDTGGNADTITTVGNGSVSLTRLVIQDGTAVDMALRGFAQGENGQFSAVELIVQDQFNADAPDARIEQVWVGGNNVWNTLASGQVLVRDLIRTNGTAGDDVIHNVDMNIVNNGSNGFFIESIQGSGGNDTFIMSHFNLGSQIVEARSGAGNDTVIASGDGIGIHNNAAFPIGDYETAALLGDGNNTFISLSGGHRWFAGRGEDTYIWKGGKISISDSDFGGGPQNDTLIIDHGNVSLSDLQFSTPFSFAHHIKLNDSSDMIQLEGDMASVDWLTFSAENSPLIPLNGFSGWQMGGASDDTLSGNIVIGHDGNDTLSGTAGDDVLAGGRGNDTLISNSGKDHLDGGDGNDLFIYSKSAVSENSVRIVGGQGADSLQINLTGEQFQDAAVLNDIFLYQNFLAGHVDTSTLNGAGLTLEALGITVADMEAFSVVVDGVEVSNFTPPTNLMPEAKDDTFTIISGQTLTGNLLADNGNGSDTDPNAGQTLSAVAQTISTASGGSVNILANGSFTYTSGAGFVGQDSFIYTADDGFGGQDTATATITVNEKPNRAPVAVDDLVDADGKATVSGNVMADNGYNGFGVDYDPDRNPLSVQSGTIATAQGGTVILQADGSFSYTAADGFEGEDTFNYTLTDTRNGSDAGTVRISNISTVAPNAAPLAQDDVIDAAGQAVASGNVLANDTDPDAGDSLTAEAQTLTTAQGGTVNLQADGGFTYTATEGFRGSDSFSYTARDGAGATDSANASINNIFTNRGPLVQNDILNAVQSATAVGNVLANDTDPDGDALTTVAQTITTAGGNTATISSDGHVTVQAADGFRGADTFSYTAQDSFGAQSTATVTVDNLFTNREPVAAADSFDAGGQKMVSGNLLVNDSDADGDAFAAMAQTFTTQAGNLVNVNADGTFTMTAKTGFSGADSFQYMIEDSFGATSTATVNVSGLLGETSKPTINLQSVNLNVDVREIVIDHEYIPPPPNFPLLTEYQAVDTSIINGVTNSNLTLNESHEVKVKFVTEGAGYKNSLGFYTIDADGRIGNVQMLAENLSGTGSGVFGGGGFNAGDLIANLGVLAAGTQIGFFIVADGYSANNDYNTFNFEGGHLEFRDTKNGNSIADISDKGKFVDLVLVNDTTGQAKQVSGNLYHTASMVLNEDGLTHAISGFSADGNLQLGFEDLKGYGDRDFNDVVIEIEVGPHIDHVLDPVDVLAGMDIATPDGGLLAGATVAFSSGKHDGDVLTIDITALQGTGISMIQNADGSLTFNGTASEAVYEALLRSVTFSSNAADPEAGVRGFDVTVTDDHGQSVSAHVDLGVANNTAHPVTPDIGTPPEEGHSLYDDVDDALSHASAFTSMDGVHNLTLSGASIDALHGGVTMEDCKGNDKLKVNIADMLDMTEDRIFAVLGDKGDIFKVVGGTLTNGHTETHNGNLYNVYSVGEGRGTIVVDADVTVQAQIIAG